jgi:pimeloyl-ACP methyl ester carboxylesterase
MGERTPRGTAYELSDSGDAAVVLVHGLGLNRKSWQWQVPALAKRYRIITYDLHGHGESSLPPEKPSLAMFSDQLRELLDHLRIARAGVIGFSLGGMISRRFAMDRPERLWALGVLHSAHARDKAAQDAILLRVEQARAEGPAATVEAALRRWFTDDFRAANPALMKLIRGWILANRKEVYWPIYRVLADGVAELIAPEPPIAVPALVMTADQDFGNSPAMSRAIATEIPGSELVILPGLRHMALAEAPDLFNAALLGFLGRAQGHSSNS